MDASLEKEEREKEKTFKVLQFGKNNMNANSIIKCVQLEPFQEVCLGFWINERLTSASAAMRLQEKE